MTPIEIIVAADAARGIGRDGDLPWRLPGEMAHFKETTTAVPDGAQRNAVIMGRRTWDSIPEKFRPLRRRLNVVVSGNPDLELPQGVLRGGSLAEAVAAARSSAGIGRIFVIGGASLYREAVGFPTCHRIHLTEVDATFDCDTFFPDIADSYRLETTSEPRTEGEITYRFTVWVRR